MLGIIDILKYNKNNMKQTGFLYKIEQTDYITGSSPLLIPEVNPTGDWQEYQPNGEKQYKYATFDTFSCTTFSALNVIETWVNYFVKNNLFSKTQRETLNSLGFFADGKFNCSDRFTAIMSDTMPNGNYLQNVLNSIRKDGLLPEALFQFGGNNQQEYLNKSLITEEMKTKAKKILDILDISYEWEVFVPGQGTTVINNSLKQCPIQGAIPEQATHAVEIIAPGFYFDSYEPYIKPLPYVRYAMKIIVKVKPEVVKYKYFSAKEIVGLKPELVQLLDKMRGECGFPFIINSGFRTVEENNKLKDAVNDSSHTLGLAVDLKCLTSDKRFKIIESAIKNGITRIGVGSTFIHLDIDGSKPQMVTWLY